MVTCIVLRAMPVFEANVRVAGFFAGSSRCVGHARLIRDESGGLEWGGRRHYGTLFSESVLITTLLPTEHMAHCTLDLLGAAGSLD